MSPRLKIIVPKLQQKTEPEVLVLQTGSIEIPNIKVNEEFTNSTKELNDLKQEWFEKVEEDSKNLFEIAEEASKNHPEMKVFIVKRLPRHDQPFEDILGIKPQLSPYANSIYDQLWIKKGGPKNIHIIK